MRVEHPFAPVFDSRSRILILGSFPSVRSREEGFYYGHPQNRFWRVLAAVYGGGKHCWKLRGDFTLRRENGTWLLTGSRASTY